MLVLLGLAVGALAAVSVQTQSSSVHLSRLSSWGSDGAGARKFDCLTRGGGPADLQYFQHPVDSDGVAAERRLSANHFQGARRPALQQP